MWGFVSSTGELMSNLTLHEAEVDVQIWMFHWLKSGLEREDEYLDEDWRFICLPRDSGRITSG